MLVGIFITTKIPKWEYLMLAGIFITVRNSQNGNIYFFFFDTDDSYERYEAELFGNKGYRVGLQVTT